MTLRGFGYPNFQPTTRGYLVVKTDGEVLKGNLRTLLETSPMERVMLDDYGVGLDNFLFEQDSTQLHQSIRERIIDQINQWEPRIVVDEITVQRPTKGDIQDWSPSDGEHALYVRIVFSPKSDLSDRQVLETFFK